MISVNSHAPPRLERPEVSGSVIGQNGAIRNEKKKSVVEFLTIIKYTLMFVGEF